MYPVEAPSVTEVVQTHCAHLSRPLFSHLLPPHEISMAIFPCKGLILSFFLCARIPICPFWQGMDTLSLPCSLPCPHLHTIPKAGSCSSLPEGSLCSACHLSSPYSVISQTSFLLPTNPIVLHFPLPFSPFSFDLFQKKCILIIDKNIFWYFWIN